MLNQTAAELRLPDPTAAFTDWLEAEGGARLIVERSGRIAWSNTRARRLLSEKGWLSGAGGELAATARGMQAELQAFLENLNGGPEVKVLADGDETKPPLVIVGCALRVDSGDYLGLRLRQVSDSPRMLLADLTPVYRLTGTERQVVRRLIEGDTVEMISKATGQSLDIFVTELS